MSTEPRTGPRGRHPRLLRGVASALLVSLGGCYVPMQPDGYRQDPTLLPRGAAPRRADAATGRATPAPKGPLSLGDILYRLLRGGTEVEVRRLQERVLDAQARVAPRVRSPVLRIMNLSSEVAQDDSGGPSVALRWSPPFPGELRAERARAAALAQVARLRLDAALYDRIAAARRLHAEWQLGRRRLALLTQLLDIQRRRRAHQERKVQAGTASRVRADLGSLREIEVEQQIAATGSRQAQLQARLLGLLSIRGEVTLATRPGARVEAATLPTREALLRETLARHPALLEAKAAHAAQHAAQWLAKSARYPWLSFVQLEYETGPKELPHRFLLGLSVRLPIFEWGGGRVRLAEERMRLAGARRRLLRARITGEVEQGYQAAQSARRAVERFRLETRQRIAIILGRTRDAASRPGVDPDEVFRVQILAVRLELLHLQHLRTYALALIALDRVAARPVWRLYGIRLGGS